MGVIESRDYWFRIPIAIIHFVTITTLPYLKLAPLLGKMNPCRLVSIIGMKLLYGLDMISSMKVTFNDNLVVISCEYL